MYFQVYQDNSNEWRWRLRAPNHYIIAVSSEGYVNRDDCLHAIGLVKGSHSAPIYESSS